MLLCVCSVRLYKCDVSSLLLSYAMLPRRTSPWLLLFCALLLLVPARLWAQSGTSDTASQPGALSGLSFSVGGADVSNVTEVIGQDARLSESNDLHLALRTGVSLDTRLGVFSARLAGVFLEVPERAQFLDAPPLTSVKDAALLYGIVPFRWVSVNLPLSLSAGVAYTHITRRGKQRGCSILSCNYEKIESGTIGFPLEARLSIGAHENFAPGVSLFANLNDEYSYWGISIDLAFR